jgi:predicted DNA binding CopG/RHH family protein
MQHGELAAQLGLPPKATAIRRAKEIGARAKSVSITIRLPERGLDRAKAIAEKKGLAYQTYIKMLIHEGLERDKSILLEG